MPVNGIDVSNNNGNIDWPAVAKAGILFAYVKVTEGATYHDPLFARNYSGAKAAGLLRGAYCFARPGTSSAQDEAAAFVSEVTAAGGFELPPALDMEDAGGLSSADLVAWCRAWAAAIKPHYAGRPLLYASPAFIREHGLAALADTFDLWLADYAAMPDLGGWPRPYVFWQYSSSGGVPGISGHVDLDLYNGSLADLQKPGGITVATDPTIQRGATGAAVVKLQKLLNQHGAKLKVDGIFGPATQAAVRNFQGAHHLTMDGIVGPQTWGALEAPAPTPSLPTPSPAPKPAPQPASGRTDLATWQGDLLNDAFYFDLPISCSDPSTTGIGKLIFDTGAYEILLSQAIADSIGCPNLGPTTVGGVGGDVQAYSSEITVVIGDRKITMPCVVDPQWDLMTGSVGLFGLRGLIDNSLGLDMNTVSAKVTIYDASK
ncbi:MAG: peptidoglycan-binding protein [Alicyclobacillus sp.]|nr:peptidoglycan-binding protein [Alicyclobacillus sp.]